MAETCPSCSIGRMMPEKFSNYYMCDFCGNRVYHWSGKYDTNTIAFDTCADKLTTAYHSR